MNIAPPLAAAGSADKTKLGIVNEPLAISSAQTKPMNGAVRDSMQPPIQTSPGVEPPDQVTVRGWLRLMLEAAALLVQTIFPPTFKVALKPAKSWPPEPEI